MVYILFSQDKIFGVYQNEDLLQHNCYVFLYERFQGEKVDTETYFRVKKLLFENKNISVNDLRKIMNSAGIFIDDHENQTSGLTALKNILYHIERRFNYLEENMGMDSRITVTIPGRNALDNEIFSENIERKWQELDTRNYTIIRDTLYKYLVTRIQKLQYQFKNRVFFGPVSDTNASETSYQLWPADKENWDVPNGTKIPGDGLATCFQYQVPGVFGIVVDPLFGYNNI